MSEFGNRIDAQRQILKTVGECEWAVEPLFSLTKKSIDRWIIKNQLNENSTLPTLLLKASDKLFFLANKSQEQITEDYQNLSNEVESIHKQISNEVSRLASS